MTAARLSIRGYAKHRGVDEKAVRKALAAGRITKGADGRIDRDAADRQWTANTDPARTAPFARVAPGPAPQRPAPVTADVTAAADFARARLANEILKGRERTMYLAQREARLVDRAAAEQLFHAMQARFLEAFRAWSPRAGDELARSLGLDPVATRREVERVVAIQLAEMKLHPFDLGRQT
jgi:hypothetical protein